MADAGKPKDLVITYSVTSGGANECPELAGALEAGYRVVDIVSTPASTFVSVTVFLVQFNAPSSTKLHYYKYDFGK